MTIAIFHDFPGLENGLPKFHDQGAPCMVRWGTRHTPDQWVCYTTHLSKSNNSGGLWLHSYESDFGYGLTELKGCVGPWRRHALY